MESQAARVTVNGSRIFQPFRALGLCSSHLPLVLKYHPVHKHFLIFIPLGKVIHVYNTKLGLTHITDQFPDDVTCIATTDLFSFAASGNEIRLLKYQSQITKVYLGHKSKVRLILPIGEYFLSIDEKSSCIIWEIDTGEKHTEMTFDNKSFEISAVLHPSTYLNKILFASQQGKMQLWNIRKNTMIYEFSGWNSHITTLIQAPAVDVVAVGLANGDIILHNIKVDKTIMKFHQDFGPVTGLTFKTDGDAILVSAGTTGSLSIWNLNEQRLVGVMEAHDGSVAGLAFLHGQPMLVSNGADNTVKIWAFDQSDGLGRLLRIRNGHSGPPTRLRFHDEDGMNIISSGADCQLRTFSTDYEGKNRNFGKATMLSKSARKRNKKHGMLPPIVDFRSETSREGFWDNIVAQHHRHNLVTTWNYKKGTLGEHKLRHERFELHRDTDQHAKQQWKNSYVTSIEMTSCGNFCLVGMSSGHCDIFNVQSGMHRGTLIDPMFRKTQQSHTKAVRGIACDALNQVVATAGGDDLIKFWKFKPPTLIKKIRIDRSPSIVRLHRGSSMLAVATDDNDIIIYDMETQKQVRNYVGHTCSVTDATWSNDGRWLVTSGMDCTIRTWDLPSGCMIDCFLVDSAATSVALSPTSDVLATSHIDELGIYLWSNKTIFQFVSLRPIPDDFDPEVVTILPGEKIYSLETEHDTVEEVEQDEMVSNDFKSKDQLKHDLITLSGLPNSRWASLLMLDAIKEKNKPKQPPKAPEHAPFFLPTVAGLVPKFDTNAAKKDEAQSKISNISSMEGLSEFGRTLMKCSRENNYEKLWVKLESMGPTSTDREIRCLSPDLGGSIELLQVFLQFLLTSLKTNNKFELVESYLGLVLKVHTEMLASNQSLTLLLHEIEEENTKSWPELQNLFDQSLCLVNFIKSVTL